MSKIDLKGKTLKELVTLIDKKEVSPSEVNRYYNAQVDERNEELNAYLTMNDSPLSKEAEKSRFRGIPVAMKDNFCTDGLRTTAASLVLDEFVPPYDSTVAANLKNAGFYIQGKTNLDAWAHGSSTETSDYGPTKNPHDITRAPGGSSGGSAAAVAAGMVPVGIGSETAGSTRLPASWCGVVGIKPTYGRVSRYGVIAMGSSLDCPGPLTLTVEDGAMVLEEIAGYDPYDATTTREPVEEYSKLIKPDNKYTIGVSKEYFDGVESSITEAVEKKIKELEGLGHTVKEVELLSPSYSISVYTIIQRAEVASNLGRYHGVRYSGSRELFGKEAKKRVMLGTYALAHGYADAFYKRAQKVRTLIIDDFKRVFKDVDFIISPTTPITALPLGEFENYPFFGEKMDVLSEPSSIAGLPGTSQPIGVDKDGLPIGLQIVGNYFKEADMLNLARQVEDLSK